MHGMTRAGPSRRTFPDVGAARHTLPMNAAALLTRLAEVLDSHDWDALPDLLHPDFTCTLVHTGEVFGRDGWVRLNADYPGFQRFVVEDLLADGPRAVVRGRVTGRAPDGSEQTFAVASFASTEGGLITELTEVWTDVDQQAPDGTRP